MPISDANQAQQTIAESKQSWSKTPQNQSSIENYCKSNYLKNTHTQEFVVQPI